jgi:hypothetical protein
LGRPLILCLAFCNANYTQGIDRLRKYFSTAAMPQRTAKTMRTVVTGNAET